MCKPRLKNERSDGQEMKFGGGMLAGPRCDTGGGKETNERALWHVPLFFLRRVLRSTGTVGVLHAPRTPHVRLTHAPDRPSFPQLCVCVCVHARCVFCVAYGRV